MTLDPVFPNTLPSELKIPKSAKTCTIRIAALIDGRRSAEMIGVHAGRPIRAPDDRQKWLHSILSGLRSRQIDLSFSSDGQEAPAGARDIAVTLTTAWITNTQVNASATAVFKVTSADNETGTFFRGNNSRMTYWSSGKSTLQSGMDAALTNVLDNMAQGLHHLCGNEVSL